MSDTPEISSAITPEPEPGAPMTFFEHLVELRKCIINSLVSVLIGAGVGWYVAPHFIGFITKPMLMALGSAGMDQKLVYTSPTGYLSLLISLSIYLGIVLASPIVLYQFWLFVAPALYKHERGAITGFLVSTVFLFLSGIAFGYKIMLPSVLKFLVGFKGTAVPMIS